MESQLRSHFAIGLNIGLTAGRMRQVSTVLAERVDTDAARRAREALAAPWAAKKGG